MIKCPILVGGGGSTEQLGIYPIGTDGRPTGDVIVPNGVTSLYQYIFYQDAAITSVSLPNSVTSLGTYCFGSCSSLTSITIPNSVTSLGTYCLYGCSSLTSITINGSIIVFASSSFQGCTAMTTFNTVSEFNPTSLNLSYTTVLTVDSMVSMFNNLATIGTTKTITLGTTNLAKLTNEQKAIATGKGWTLA